MLIIPGPEAGLQDQPQARETCEGTIGGRHGAGHEGGPGLVPKQVKWKYMN